MESGSTATNSSGDSTLENLIDAYFLRSPALSLISSAVDTAVAGDFMGTVVVHKTYFPRAHLLQ